tara:strand:- start:1645 stop:2961 length:1317 start_codon:yes stop_codon:yes gene_type:complete
MDKVNLDINTYTLSELENLLRLLKPYKEEDIHYKKNNLQNQILKSNINESKKEELYIFLDNIKNKLSSEYLNSLNKENIGLNDVKKYDGNHFIINNKNNEYVSVLENNKSVNKSIIKKTFTIDSIFRPNYDNPSNKSDDYIIELPETITNAITMSMSSLEIPLSYHNISDNLNNNIFRIELIDASNQEQSWDITLISGLYESLFTSVSQKKAQNIVDEINKQIIANVTENDITEYLKFGVNLQSGFSYFTYENHFAVNEANKVENGAQITINFNINNDNTESNCSKNELYQKLGWQLGFRSNNVIIDKDSNPLPIGIAETVTVISPGICHISYPRYIYICVDDFQTSSRNYFSIAAQSCIVSNIVGRINILSCLEDKTAFKNAGAPGDYLYNNKYVREYFGPTDIQKLRVQLLDEYGRKFSINNMDWSFVASWECFYN